MESDHGDIDESIRISNLTEYLSSKLTEKQIDFIVYVNTGWQALGANAKINSYASDRTGIVIIPEFSLGNRTTTDDFSVAAEHDVEFVHLTGFDRRNILDKAFEKMTNLYGFWNMGKSVDDSKQSIDIITKESYMDKFSCFLCSEAVSERYYPQYVVIDSGFEDYISGRDIRRLGSLNYVYERVADRIKERHIRESQVCPRQLFSLEGGKMVVNERIKVDYQNVLPQPTGTTQELAVILTQPNEVFEIPDQEWRSLIARVTGELAKKGYDVVIKPHPSEDPSKYERIDYNNLEVIKDDTDVETLVADLNPEIAVGYTTTALVTLNMLFEIDTYTIADTVVGGVDFHIGRSKQFKYRTSNYVESFETL